MDKVKEAMAAMGVLPKLRLGEKLPGSGAKSYGPKQVKFLAEPIEGTKKDFAGKPQKTLRFEVEHEKTRYWWYVKMRNKENEPNYLLDKLAAVKVGDERILEMRKIGIKNYIDVREVGAPINAPEEDEGEEDAPTLQYGE